MDIQVPKTEIEIPLANFHAKELRDGSGHHVSITEPSEPILNFDDKEYYCLGVGVSHQCYYYVIGCPDLQLQRLENGLKFKDFHATLAFYQKDIHDIYKGPKTLVKQSFDLSVIISCLEHYFRIFQPTKWKSEMHKFSLDLIDTVLGYEESEKLLEHKALIYFSKKDYKSSIAAAQQGLMIQETSKLLIRFADGNMKLERHGEALIAYWKAYIKSTDKQKVYCWLKIKQLWKLGIASVEFYMQNSSVRLTVQEYTVYQQERCFVMDSWEEFEPMMVEDPRVRLHVDFITANHDLPRFFSWICPFLLAGMSTPKSRDDILALEQLGVGTVITLTEEEPLPIEYFQDTNVKNIFWPITNYYTPFIAHADAFMQLIAKERCSETPKAILVHCGGGKGRAGSLLCTYIARFGLSVPPTPCDLCQVQPAYRCITSGCFFAQDPVLSSGSAIDLLRRMRPGSIETEKQERFVGEYVSDLWSRSSSNTRIQVQKYNEPSQDTVYKVTGNKSIEPKLIILCGLPASGKSTFAKRVKEKGWRIVSQDDQVQFGVHKTNFEKELQVAAKKGKVVVDRCNPTVHVRKNWKTLAGNPPTAVLYFNVSAETCIKRAVQRLTHPTLQPWQAKNAIELFDKQMQKPTLNEGYDCIYEVTSFEQIDSLLLHFKVTPETEFFKYPRTRHLYDIGGASRDDLIFSEADALAFLNPTGDVRLTAQEKMDGANLGFRLDSNGNILCQNRTHIITSSYHPQFEQLQSWVYNHKTCLLKILSENCILFGEWLAAKHSIHYDRLSDIFLAFDIYDISAGQFYSAEKTATLLQDTTIKTVPKITLPPNLTKKMILEVLESNSSYCSNHRLEGLVLRLDSKNWLSEKAKIVRTDFITDNDHWSKHSITWNVIE